MRIPMNPRKDKRVFRHTAFEYTRKLNTMAFRNGIRL